MSKVIFDIAVSLDGFLAGEHRGPQNPLGDKGTTLHHWMYGQKAFWGMMNIDRGEEGSENDLVKAVIARSGAFIMGKRMFEEGEAHWPEDLFKADVYVLTHEPRAPWVQKGSTTFHFITGGIDQALELARKSAKGKDVRIQGGGETIQAYLNAGYIDEAMVHIAPVLLGSGIRLFDNITDGLYDIAVKATSHSPLAAHITYTFKRK